jgi:diguanylate cyclase (GGDEF)-like protein
VDVQIRAATRAAAAVVAAAGVAVGAVRISDRWRARVAREDELRAENRRLRFADDLDRALQNAEDEDEVVDLLDRAVTEAAPETSIEFLLSGGTVGARLRAVAPRDESARPGCGVPTVRECPAVRLGRTLVFPSSAALDACSWLRDRPGADRSGACVPVASIGRPLGVIHTTGPDGQPTDREGVERLELLAHRVGDRLGGIRDHRRAVEQAATDPLTGLLNRRSVLSRTRDLVRDLVPFSTAICDVDLLADLNERKGHEEGDRVLRLTAEVLGDTLRPDDILGRVDGNQFLAVFPHTSALHAAAALERVRERLALRLTEWDGPGYTCSFGVADSNQGESVDEILEVADFALLLAKEQGGNRVRIAGEDSHESTG